MSKRSKASFSSNSGNNKAGQHAKNFGCKTPKSVFVKDPSTTGRQTTFKDLHKGNLNRAESLKKPKRNVVYNADKHREDDLRTKLDRNKHCDSAREDDVISSATGQASSATFTWRDKVGLPSAPSTRDDTTFSMKSTCSDPPEKHEDVLLAENKYLRAKVDHYEKCYVNGAKAKQLSPEQCWERISYVTNANIACVAKLNEEITHRILGENGLAEEAPVRRQLHDRCTLFVGQYQVIDVRESFIECREEERNMNKGEN